MITPLFIDYPYPLWVVSIKSKDILTANKAVTVSYGYAIKDLLSKSFTKLLVEEEVLLSDPENTTSNRECFQLSGTANLKDKSGNIHPVKLKSFITDYKGSQALMVKAVPLESNQGPPQSFIQAETELQNHLSDSPLAYAIWDQDFKLRKFSPKISEWLGFTEDVLLGERSLDLAFKHVINCDFQKVEQQIDAILSGKETSNQLEFGVTAENGTTVYLKFYNSALTDKDGSLTSVLSLIENRTEAVRNERIKSRQRELFESTSAFICLAKPDGIIDYMNPSGKTILELPKKTNLRGTNIAGFFTESTNKLLRREGYLKTEKLGVWKGELNLKTTGDKVIPVSTVMTAHKDRSGKLEYFSFISQDISQEKRYIGELKDRERKLRYLAENATDKVAIFDSEANCIYASPSTESLIGYTPEEYMELDIISQVHPDDRPAIRQNLIDLQNGEGQELITYRLRHKQGHYIWVENSMKPIYDEKGHLLEVRSAARDVSDRIAYQQQLEKEKEFSDKVINSIPGLFYVLDEEGNFLRLNNGFVQELGYSRREAKKMNPLDFYFDEDHDRISDAIQQAFAEGNATQIAKVKKKEGSYDWFHLTGSHFRQDGKNYILGTGINISDRIRAEQRLKHQTELLNNLFQRAPVGIAMVNQNDEILDVNDSFETMFGYSREDINGINIDNLITPEPLKIEQKEILQKQKQGKDSFQYESVRIRKDGSEIPVLMGLVPVTIDENSVISYLIYVDITDRKAYLEELKNSLREKQVLLQEIHHRVKNNLAVVSSLLQLQRFSTENKQVQKVLSESEMRIQTMGLIHEQLYNTESLSQIHLDQYLQKLIHSIKNIHDPDDLIEFSVKSNGLVLNVNQAVPCGMILNELISNAIEHAFNSQGKNKVNIAISEESGKVTLVIQDNGSGIPSDFDPATSGSMGYTIVNTLVQQLDAILNVQNKNGTIITIAFEKIETRGSSSLLLG